MKKYLSLIVTALLFFCLPSSMLNFETREADANTKYVGADESINPPSSSIPNVGGVYFSLIANISSSIEVILEVI